MAETTAESSFQTNSQVRNLKMQMLPVDDNEDHELVNCNCSFRSRLVSLYKKVNNRWTIN